MNLVLGVFTTLFVAQAHAFLVDAGALRDRPIVNRCMAALIGPAPTEVDGDAIQAKLRKLFLGPIPLAEVSGDEVAEGQFSEAAGLTEVLPRRWRWFKYPNPFGATMRDQRLLRLAIDLKNPRVKKTVRVYKGQTEIDEFLARQAANSAALDEKLRPFLRSDFRVRKTLVGAIRLAVLGAVGYWGATAGGWPIAGLLLGSAGLFDAGSLFLRAKYAVGKVLAPKSREPLDPRTLRLEAGLTRVARSLDGDTIALSSRQYLGITSFVPNELAPLLETARSIDDIPAAELERLATVRHGPPALGAVLGDYALPFSTDYLFVPGATPAESELIVVNRLGRPRSN